MKDQKKNHIVRERPLTYDDYANLPDDGNRYELVDGVLELMSPAPTSQHQMISHEIEEKLKQTCQKDYVIFHAPIDVILTDTITRQPDVVLVHYDRFSQVVRKRGIVGVPDLIVEILSPSSVKRDRESKMRSYEKCGVPEYWIVDPANEALEQYVLDGDRYPLPKIYESEDTVQSDRVQCASFTMKEILENIPEIPED
jgi:Uma2 family endonuclease